jgi:FkbM family methyltransferase
LQPGDLAFDVGANVGRRAEVFLQLGARVIAVEPQPVCLELLRKKYVGQPRVVVVGKALGRRPGLGELMLSPAHTLSSMSEDWIKTVTSSGRFRGFQAHSWKRSTTVPITTLDDLIGEFGVPAFCKIDVEGYEAEVLRGLSHPIPALSFEFAPEFMAGTRECLRILANLGPCDFNYSLGESMSLALPKWTTVDGISEALMVLSDRNVFGDIYARFHRSADPRGR